MDGERVLCGLGTSKKLGKMAHQRTKIEQEHCLNLENTIIEFYNRVTLQQVNSLEGIPSEALSFLLKLNYDDLVKPFVIESEAKGRSLAVISRRFRVF